MDIEKIGRNARRQKIELETALKRNKVTHGEAQILHCVCNREKVIPSDIADILAFNRTAVSRYLKSLEEKKLVVRKNKTTDRREVIVCSTQKGFRVAKNIFKADFA